MRYCIHAIMMLNSSLYSPDTKTSKLKDVSLKILVPLYDRLDVHRIKVVAMIKGKFQSKIINAERVYGKTTSIMFNFERNTDIGRIQVGNEFFACVSADELNPQEGTECEKRHVKPFDEPMF